VKKKLASVLGLTMVAAVIGLGLTGCSSSTGTAAAQDQPASVSADSQQTGIWVSGTGKVTVTPNIANLSLGITAQASTVGEAQSQAVAAVNRVMSALTSNGVDQKDIQTQYYSIQQINTPITVIPIEPSPTPGTSSTPAILPPTPVPGKGVEYQVSNTVSVKVRSIDKTGSIIDAVVAAGGDLTRVDSVTFSVDNPEQYYPQARQLAMNDAAAKASQLAKLAGVTLGKATYISESSSTPVLYFEAFSGQGAVPAAATSINPGQTDITVNVQVAYAIR